MRRRRRACPRSEHSPIRCAGRRGAPRRGGGQPRDAIAALNGDDSVYDRRVPLSGQVRPPSQDAELVLLRIGKHHPWLLALSNVDASRAERLESGNLLVAVTPNGT